MIKSIDYSKIITEDLMLYGAEDKYQELIAQQVMPMIDGDGEIVAFNPIGNVRKPMLTTLQGKFANMKQELDELFNENNSDVADPQAFAIVLKYFNTLDCNKAIRPTKQKAWKELFNRIQDNPTIEDCRKFANYASGTEDLDLITAAMDVDTKSREMFGDDYLTRNDQLETPFQNDWDG